MTFMSSQESGAGEETKKSVVDITVEYIMDKINKKEWPPDTKIPTEFELMESLNVSRNSVREAIKVLSTLGLLEVRRADGTYVVNGFSEKMLAPWACSLMLEEDDSLALLELRMVIERGIFSLAIQKGTEKDMHDIYNASESFISLAQSESATSAEILNADVKYRERICEASHNHLAAQLNKMIAYASFHSREKSIEKAIAFDDRLHMVDSHRKLTDIILHRRTAELNDVLNYCYKYWGMTLQDSN